MGIDPIIRETLQNLPGTPGVYLFKDGQGKVMYVGKAKNLRNRVRCYFNARGIMMEGRRKVMAMIKHIRRIDTIQVKNEAEALILESRLLKEYKPKYNTIFVDDKRFLLIRVDTSPLPRFTLCRNRIDRESTYYGPFVQGSAVKKIYFELRRRYGVLLSDVTPHKLPDGRWQLYDDARAEIFSSPNVVTREEYLLRVAQACGFLEGQSRLWREEVVLKMQLAAEAERYEEAAKWRDLLTALSAARDPRKKFLRDPLLNILDPATTMAALQEALQMDAPPSHIECFDISHISGSFVVASMVHFTKGRPDKNRYRRFRIRGEDEQGPVGNDDYRAMREVVNRHYSRMVREDIPLPGLIVIDGGAGQLKSALAAFIEGGITQIPLMIGLAKREETFIFADGRPPLTLPRTNLGLRLLQRVRDEAHRVANSYNAQWRSRELKKTLLDDCPGLGPVKRAKIFKKFSTLERLKRASVEEIAEVVGPKLAQVVHDFCLAGRGESIDQG